MSKNDIKQTLNEVLLSTLSSTFTDTDWHTVRNFEYSEDGETLQTGIIRQKNETNNDGDSTVYIAFDFHTSGASYLRKVNITESANIAGISEESEQYSRVEATSSIWNVNFSNDFYYNDYDTSTELWEAESDLIATRLVNGMPNDTVLYFATS